MTGRLVKVIADEMMNEGENEIILNASEVKAGIYFLRMDATEYNSMKKMYVVNR
jgi:hypothetical protein